MAVANQKQMAPAARESSRLPDFWVSGLDQSKVGEDGKAVERWVRMGVAYFKKDGKGGITVHVSSTPLTWNGTMLLQPPQDGEKE